MSCRWKPTSYLAVEPLERREMLSVGSAGFSAWWARGVPAVVADDYGNTAAQAGLISLSSAGSGSQSGRIERAGDVDVFRFVSPVTGRMTIQELAAAGSWLDTYLYAYDGNGQPLARNDDYGGSLNSRVAIDVTAGETYYVKAAAYGWSTGAYAVQISTVATKVTPTPTPTPSPTPSPTPTPTPAPGAFQIDVTMTGMTAAQQQIVQQAVDRWEQIIVGDLPNATYRGRVIDDLAVDISGVNIDGTGGILGEAAATNFRNGSWLPYRGYIQFDTADVAAMQRDGSFLGVLEHEIGHVLGIGIIWSDLGLLAGGGTSNPRFTGARATAEYNALFGTNQTSVPVEASGGGGTAPAHWRESTFGSELMTGWYNTGRTNALSRITVASLADLGYQVNMAAADSYTPPASASSASSARLAAPASWSYYSPSGVSSSVSWHGRHDDRLRAVDMIMASQAGGLDLIAAVKVG